MKPAQPVGSCIVGISLRDIFPGLILLSLLLGGCQNPKTAGPASISEVGSEEFETLDPDRPPPPVPETALLLGDLANLDLLITADRAGQIQKVSISKPSKAKVFDERTRRWVQEHWKMPPAKSNQPDTRQFLAPIVYPKANWPKGGKYPPPKYPESALRQHIQGAVGLRIDVDETGHVKATDLVVSSGSPLLDENTQSWVQTQWKFPPGQSRLVLWVCIYEMGSP